MQEQATTGQGNHHLIHHNTNGTNWCDPPIKSSNEVVNHVSRGINNNEQKSLVAKKNAVHIQLNQLLALTKPSDSQENVMPSQISMLSEDSGMDTGSNNSLDKVWENTGLETVPTAPNMQLDQVNEF